MNIFGGMKILRIYFGGHCEIGLYLGVISLYFRVFSRYRIGIFLRVAKI